MRALLFLFLFSPLTLAGDFVAIIDVDKQAVHYSDHQRENLRPLKKGMVLPLNYQIIIKKNSPVTILCSTGGEKKRISTSGTLQASCNLVSQSKTKMRSDQDTDPLQWVLPTDNTLAPGETFIWSGERDAQYTLVFGEVIDGRLQEIYRESIRQSGIPNGPWYDKLYSWTLPPSKQLNKKTAYQIVITASDKSAVIKSPLLQWAGQHSPANNIEELMKNLQQGRFSEAYRQAGALDSTDLNPFFTYIIVSSLWLIENTIPEDQVIIGASALANASYKANPEIAYITCHRLQGYLNEKLFSSRWNAALTQLINNKKLNPQCQSLY